jgi:hypothetical protein
MIVSSVASAASATPLVRHKHLTMGALSSWRAIGALTPSAQRARRREIGGSVLVLGVGRMVSTASAVCASWSIITVFCSFANGMTLLLKTRLLAHHSKKPAVRSAWKPFFFSSFFLLFHPSSIATTDHESLTLELDAASFLSAPVWFTAFFCSRGADKSVDTRLLA